VIDGVRIVKEYAVIQVRSIVEEVELLLIEVRKEEVSREEPLPPVPEVEIPMPAAVARPIPRSDEERMVARVAEALRKFMPEMFETALWRPWLERKISELERRIHGLLVETSLKLYLTREEYERLGKPTVNDIVKIGLTVMR